MFYNKADKSDVYVSPVPDYRLGLSKIFTLAEPISESTNTITVEENPGTCPMNEGRRIVKIGEELINYQSYTSERPYQFIGCRRGYLRTTAYAREKGFKFGLLDVDTWDRWVRIDQQTSLPLEVADRIGKIYNQAGFKFIYLDGAEDVNPPYWFNISNAQKVVFDQLHPSPILIESAARTHFSWHLVSRANAFDLQEFSPGMLKDAIRKYSLREAQILDNDFSKGEFGWVTNQPAGYEKNDTIGIQPDMVEFATSRAAGWDTGTSLWTQLSWSDQHPRAKDIFEVFRRWEAVKEKNILTAEQKVNLRNPNQEHILLINENKEFELMPYSQILELPTNKIRAFHFQRNGNIYVVYWHTQGEGQLILPIKKGDVQLFDSLGGSPLIIKNYDGQISIPAGDRRYLICKNLTLSQVITAFRNLHVKNF